MMKLRKIIFYLAVIILLTTQLNANTNPVVSNVSYSYNRGVISIFYDVSDAEDATVTIVMFVSSNSGTTWDYSCTQTSGDVGSGVSVGAEKLILWNHDAEHGGSPSGSNFLIKIIANDEQPGASPCVGFEKIYYDGGPNTDSYGAYYNTVQIGDQCWLKENLNAGIRVDLAVTQTNNATIEKYCYDDNASNCNVYGGLYQWFEAMGHVSAEGSQGICPTGFHVPTYAELEVLKNMANDNSKALKEIGQGAPGGMGTNTSGFSALLAGFASANTSYVWITRDTFIWSSKGDGSGYFAYYMNLKESDTMIDLGQKAYDIDGFSVRCIKD